LFVLVLSSSAVAETETAREHPDRRIGALVTEFIATINRGDPAELLDFSREGFDEEMLRGMPPDAWATFLENVYDGKSPIEICCFKLFERIPQGMAVAVIHDTRGDTWSSLQIRFDEADRISSLMIVPAKPPMEFVELAKIDDTGLARELDASLTELAAKDEFSGAVLIARNGKTLFSKAYGLASREHQIPNQIDTRFSLGSMNKMFTAVAIAQLAEQGKLAFDDTVGSHLPDYPNEAVREKVQIRHLLSHTSGMGSHFNRAFMEASKMTYRDIDDYI